MNSKHLFILSMGLCGFCLAESMELRERIETKIANNRWFVNETDVRYVCGDYDIFDTNLQDKMIFERCRCEYTMHGLSFEPRAFWKLPTKEQLLYLKEAIQELDLLNEAPKHHWALNCTNDKRCGLCLKSRSYSKELEEKFEIAVWKILSKDYKITLEDFQASLRSALDPKDRLYTAPLLMHFTNYLVPRYKFYYKENSFKPYKTEKYPSIFEIVNGTKDEGVVVYEEK